MSYMRRNTQRARGGNLPFPPDQALDPGIRIPRPGDRPPYVPRVRVHPAVEQDVELVTSALMAALDDYAVNHSAARTFLFNMASDNRFQNDVFDEMVAFCCHLLMYVVEEGRTRGDPLEAACEETVTAYAAQALLTFEEIAEYINGPFNDIMNEAEDRMRIFEDVALFLQDFDRQQDRGGRGRGQFGRSGGRGHFQQPTRQHYNSGSGPRQRFGGTVGRSNSFHGFQSGFMDNDQGRQNSQQSGFRRRFDNQHVDEYQDDRSQDRTVSVGRPAVPQEQRYGRGQGMGSGYVSERQQRAPETPGNADWGRRLRDRPQEPVVQVVEEENQPRRYVRNELKATLHEILGVEDRHAEIKEATQSGWIISWSPSDPFASVWHPKTQVKFHVKHPDGRVGEVVKEKRDMQGYEFHETDPTFKSAMIADQKACRTPNEVGIVLRDLTRPPLIEVDTDLRKLSKAGIKEDRLLKIPFIPEEASVGEAIVTLEEYLVSEHLSPDMPYVARWAKADSYIDSKENCEKVQAMLSSSTFAEFLRRLAGTKKVLQQRAWYGLHDTMTRRVNDVIKSRLGLVGANGKPWTITSAVEDYQVLVDTIEKHHGKAYAETAVEAFNDILGCVNANLVLFSDSPDEATEYLEAAMKLPEGEEPPLRPGEVWGIAVSELVGLINAPIMAEELNVSLDNGVAVVMESQSPDLYRFLVNAQKAVLEDSTSFNHEDHKGNPRYARSSKLFRHVLITKDQVRLSVTTIAKKGSADAPVFTLQYL